MCKLKFDRKSEGDEGDESDDSDERDESDESEDMNLEIKDNSDTQLLWINLIFLLPFVVLTLVILLSHVKTSNLKLEREIEYSCKI